MRVLTHSPDIGELPDALFWLQDGEIRETVIEETPELLIARPLVYGTNPKPSWEQWTAWCDTLGEMYTPVGEFNVVDSYSPAMLRAELSSRG